MPNQIDNYIAKRLRIVRCLKGMTLEEAAGRAGISSRQLEEYESGTDKISASLLFQISAIFDVSIIWFFDRLEINESFNLVNDVFEIDSEETKELINIYYQCDENFRKSIRSLIIELARSSRH